MFGSLGWPEIMVILVIALVIFGPRKLPQLGRTLGKALGEFRRATNDLKNTLELEVHREEEKLKAPEAKKAEEEYSRGAASRQTPSQDTPPADEIPTPEQPDRPSEDGDRADRPPTQDAERE